MIRPAVPWDVKGVVALGRRFWSESPYATHMRGDPQAMQKLAEVMVTDANAEIFIHQKPEGIVGMIGVVASEHPMSGAKVMAEMFWYVEPEHRGGGVRLLRTAEDWARARGVEHSIIVDPTGTQGPLYTRLGYRKLEDQYIRAL